MTIVAMIAFVSLSGFVGGIRAENKIFQEAVAAGVAEYIIVDSKTGQTEFKWKKASSIIDVPPWQRFVFTNNNEVFTISIDKN